MEKVGVKMRMLDEGGSLCNKKMLEVTVPFVHERELVSHLSFMLSSVAELTLRARRESPDTELKMGIQILLTPGEPYVAE
jgi:hypothetical protein